MTTGMHHLMRRLPLALAAAWLGVCAPLAAADRPGPAAEQDMRQLREMYDERFRPTPFEGLYEIVKPAPPSARSTAPILVTRAAEYTFNNGRLGARTGSSGPALDPAAWGALLLRWKSQFRTADLIQSGGSGPLRVIVLSAFDCPYSRKLELALHGAGVRYAVVPSVIGVANRRFLPGLWCSADRSAAWYRAVGQGITAPPAPAGCAYDAAFFETFNGLLGGSTPTLLFADGTVSREQDPAAIRRRLAELERRGVQF